MKHPRRLAAPLVVAAAGAAALALWARRLRGPVGNPAVPQPAKPVELDRYLGAWHELARYENAFERGLEAVTAEYRRLDGGLIEVINTGREGGPAGPAKVARGRARVVEGSRGAKLKVSFFGPLFLGDYWVLDHADDYAWSIVGEPSGRFLWLLTRGADPGGAVREAVEARARELGYDLGLLRRTAH